MSAQIHDILELHRAKERAREPAIAPCAAVPLVSDAQCAAMDEMGEHLDSKSIAQIKSVEQEHPWLWALYVIAGGVSTLVISMVNGPGTWS